MITWWVRVCVCLQSVAVSTVCVITVQAPVECVGEDPVWRGTPEKTVTRRPHRATLTDCTNTVTSTHTVHTQDCTLCKILLLLLHLPVWICHLILIYFFYLLTQLVWVIFLVILLMSVLVNKNLFQSSFYFIVSLLLWICSKHSEATALTHVYVSRVLYHSALQLKNRKPAVITNSGW